ncbi:MAG: AMP-binding protein [Deltaproteobacteria bacterium]|nr:AMP-binding protein [Deltaproteobacteria bacterium]
MEWENLTIGEALRQRAMESGEDEALITMEERLTFGELYDRACRLAFGMHRLGVSKGDHVATIFGFGNGWVIAKYALHLLGAVVVPVNVNFKTRELEYVLRQADVKTILMHDALRFGNYIDMLGEIDPSIVSCPRERVHSEALPFLERIICISDENRKYPFCYDYDEVTALGADFRQADIDMFLEKGKPTDPCNILFTSGSTAFPKGAVHIHRSLLGIGEHLIGRTFGVNAEHRLINYLPFYHIGGCVYHVLASLLRGCRLYVHEFIPEDIMRLIDEEKINFFGGFDAHFNAIRNHPEFNQYDLNSVKFILLAVGPEWYDRVKEIFPAAEVIAHHYGFTEGTGVSQAREEKDYEIRKHMNGKPWPGIDIKIVDPSTGRIVPPNTPGEICLRGWSRFQEYYKNPEETRKAIDAEGFFHSGDYGWLDEKGNLAYRGRYKMMIKTGGENVSEREIEMFLEGIPGVRAVQVVGLPDEKWGEAVTAVIEVSEGERLSREKVIDYCKGRIAGFKIPKHVLFIDGSAWPLLGAGKVDKKKLKEWAENEAAKKS